MTPKDDAQFSDACQNVEKRDALLKRLIEQRRMLRTVFLLLTSLIALGFIIQLITRDRNFPSSSLLFVCMMGWFQLSTIDNKIKILLTQK